MKVDQLYQVNAKQAISLELISKEHYLATANQLPQQEQQCLFLQQFTADVASIGIVADSTGQFIKIYIGTGNNAHDAEAIAAAVNRLPAGCYHVARPLSQPALLAWALAQYVFDKYKTKNNPLRALSVTENQYVSLCAEARAVFLVRDLINSPTSDLGPQQLAEVVAGIAKETDAEFKQWVGDELLQHRFPAIHAVGRAATNEPRLIELTWGEEHHPRISLVGKGVCFDSGGLDIKPAAMMRLMKKDMGGAAHVIGLAQWLIAMRVPIRLQVLIPAVENAIAGNAYRPGDVLTMRNGTTVEIQDTDAEGRLVLADALVKACEFNPELIIDFATLTGAARVAVGTEIAALFSNDDKLAQAVKEIATPMRDPVWQLPLFAGYEGLFESSIADFSNASASSYAGAITAALFLQRFIKPGIAWMHFDIMAWNVANKPGKPEGGEAMGLRAVGHYLMQRFK